MTTHEHYEEAEKLLTEARNMYNNPRIGSERRDDARFLLQQAQVHAALAREDRYRKMDG